MIKKHKIKPTKIMTTRQNNVKITKEVRDIIHGYVMSDGYLRNGSLTVEQSAEHLRLVKWMYSKLEHLTTGTGIKTVKRFDRRTNRHTYSKRFFTRRFLKGFNKMWYKVSHINKRTGKPKYVKTLPKSINCFFTKTFISVWYAGDGTKIIGSLGAKIEATCFNDEEKLIIKQLFKTHYDIDIHINKGGQNNFVVLSWGKNQRFLPTGFSNSGTQQWTFNINSEDYDKFHNIVTEIDLIPELFPDKLCY